MSDRLVNQSGSSRHLAETTVTQSLAALPTGPWGAPLMLPRIAAASPIADVRTIVRRAMWSVAGVSAALNLLLLAGSLYMLLVYDLVLPARSVPTLTGLFAMVVVAYVFQGLLEYVRGRMLLHLSAAIDHALSDEAYRLIGVTVQRDPAGDSLSAMRDLDQLRQFLSGSGPAALADLPWMIVFIGALFLLHPLLGVTVLIGALILIGLTWATERRTRGVAPMLAQATATRARIADSRRRHAASIAALGMAGRMAARWQTASALQREAQDGLARVAGSMGAFSRMFRLLLQSAVLTVGALLVINEQASGGVIFAASILSSRALAPIDLGIANWRGLASARAAWAQLSRAIAVNPAAAPMLALALPHQRLDVAGLTLGPPGAATPTVRNISFSALAGEAIAILGPSGSGKSTLVRGLLGLWPAQAGTVRLDGAELSQWDSDLIGGHIGYLAQDAELIDGSIGQTIARFDPAAKDDAIVAAATAAGAHDLIIGFDGGYARSVGADGQALSGGERQRIALARALYGDPFLILLDEPNANLDAAGEAALIAAVRGARARGAIVIVVAHRPSVLDAVDHILLLHDGEAVAFGPKAQIMPRIGLTG
jgi:PrtD family type I secretion system ABC transporter